MVTWLHGYMVTWLHGYMVTWLHGYMVTFLNFSNFNIFTFLHRYNCTFLHVYIFTSTSTFTSTCTLQAVSCGTCDTVTQRGAVHNTDTCPRHLCTTCTTRTCVHGTDANASQRVRVLATNHRFQNQSWSRAPRGHCGEDVHPQVKTGLFGATSGDRRRRLLRGDVHEVLKKLARRFRTGGRG